MFRLIYVSDVNQDLLDSDALASLLTKARKNNAELDLTGMLLCDYVNFFQVLEGDEQQVRKLFDVIKRDQRHTNVVIVAEESCSDRLFGQWRMGFSSLENVDKQDLSRLNAEEAKALAATYANFHEKS
ncbi:BLUF domain-containing protein [Alteromonas flava]|uniref:BLUF domain-containing protein n=1 Tax=Alteromonas flava TaxID=2048003 RepID=UPI000C28C492|nr:BLUF domain-containing protein [Alteromonas flava]